MIVFPFLLTAQDASLEKRINDLQSQIAKQNDKGVKLQLTDSLIKFVENNEDYNYTSLLKSNIKLALDIDSIASATQNTADLIFYQNVYLVDSKAGIETFTDFRGKEVSSSSDQAKVNLYLYGSDSYKLIGDFDAALEALEKAEEYAKASNEDKLIAPVYYRRGFIQSRSGDLAESSLNLQKAQKLFLKLKDTLKYVNSNITLATLYDQTEFYVEAQAIREETIEISKKAKGQPSLPTLYYFQAGQYNLVGNQKERINYYELALEAVENSSQKNYYKPAIVFAAALAYAENDSITKTEQLLTSLDEYPFAKSPDFQGGIYIETLKHLAFTKKNYAEALEYGKQHLAMKKEQGNYEDIYNAEQFMANIYNVLGDSNKSNSHLVAYYRIKDSINSVKKIQTLSYYQTLYETEKRDLKIEAQESNIALLNEKNKVQNQWLLFGGLGFLSLFGFVWIVRSRNFARKKQKLQENFTKDILKTQESERARIASELHDSVGQKLLMIKNALVSKGKEDKNDIDLVGETIKEVREMSHNLHPFQFEKLGLITSLKNMVETFQKNSNVFYSEALETPDGLMSKENEIYVFRMLQEAMTNAEKHANATACNLSSQATKSHLIFTLKDNGKGFNTESTSLNEGLGMKTLKERAHFIGANLMIDSLTGKGTTVTLKIPKK